MKWKQESLIRKELLALVLNFFTGFGAVAGGLACITDPVSPLGAPLELLDGSPFETYLIPGLILIVIIGGGNLLSAAILIVKKRWAGYAEGTVSCALLIWLAVQIAVIHAFSPLHGIFFLIGIIQAYIACTMLLREHLFPFTLLERIPHKETRNEEKV